MIVHSPLALSAAGAVHTRFARVAGPGLRLLQRLTGSGVHPSLNIYSARLALQEPNSQFVNNSMKAGEKLLVCQVLTTK